MRALCHVFLLFSISLCAQAQSAPQRISTDTGTTNPQYALEHQGTVSLAQNPLNTAQLVACFEDGVKGADAAAHITCARSTDSGTRWSKVLLRRLDTYVGSSYRSLGRPALAWSSSGTLLLVVAAKRHNGTTTLVSMSSTDSGLTFSRPTLILSNARLNLTSPHLIADNEDQSAAQGSFYLAYTKIDRVAKTSALYVTQLSQNATRWSLPRQVSSTLVTTLRNRSNESAKLSIDTQGNLTAVWARLDKAQDGSQRSLLVSSQASSGAQSWSAPVEVVAHHAQALALVRTQSYAPSIYRAVSAKRLYVAYQKKVTVAYPSSIEILHRSDASSTWSSAVRLDRPAQSFACFNPSISGDGASTVVVAFQCLATAKNKVQSYYVTSFDGGSTFSAPTAIFSSSFLLSNTATVAGLRSFGISTHLVPLADGYGFVAGGAYFYSRSAARLRQVDIVWATF